MILNGRSGVVYWLGGSTGGPTVTLSMLSDKTRTTKLFSRLRTITIWIGLDLTWNDSSSALDNLVTEVRKGHYPVSIPGHLLQQTKNISFLTNLSGMNFQTAFWMWKYYQKCLMVLSGMVWLLRKHFDLWTNCPKCLMGATDNEFWNI